MATKTQKVVVPKVALPKENNHQNNKPNNNNNSEDQEVYALMERRDEHQIMESIRGNFLEEYVYQFEAGGRQVTGLSWVGTQEAAREYGGIQVSIDKTKEVETKTHFVVTVEAVDTRTGSSRLGRSKQPKMMKLKTGALVEDEFADVKALSKAQRNAIRSLLPQTWLKEFIKAKLVQNRKAVQVNQNQQPKAEVSQAQNLVCSDCGQGITKAEADYSLQNYGFELCRGCQAKHKK